MDARRSALTGTVLRAIMASSGRIALARALATWSGLGLVAAVLFGGPNAMRAHDVTEVAMASSPMRLGLLAGWTLLALPAARALLVAPESDWLRAMPLSRTQLLAPMGALLTLLELPWVLFWLRGEGAAMAAGAWLVALAAHAVAIARVRTLRDGAALIVLIALVGATHAGIVWAAAGALVAWHALPRAWVRGPERSGRARVDDGPLRVRSPAWALARALATVVVRTEKPALGRGVVLVTVGAGFFALIVRNNHITAGSTRIALRLVTASIPVVTVCSTVSGRVVPIERELAWLLRTTAQTVSTRVTSTLGCSCGAGALAGAMHGVLGAVLVRDASLAPVAMDALWGASLGAMTEAVTRATLHRERTRGSNATVAAAAVAVIAMLTASALGRAALLPALVCAIAAMASCARDRSETA